MGSAVQLPLLSALHFIPIRYPRQFGRTARIDRRTEPCSSFAADLTATRTPFSRPVGFRRSWRAEPESRMRRKSHVRFRKGPLAAPQRGVRVGYFILYSQLSRRTLFFTLKYPAQSPRLSVARTVLAHREASLGGSARFFGQDCSSHRPEVAACSGQRCPCTDRPHQTADKVRRSQLPLPCSVSMTIMVIQDCGPAKTPRLAGAAGTFSQFRPYRSSSTMRPLPPRLP